MTALILLFLSSINSQAYVTAMPMLTQLGPVEQGSTSMAVVSFENNGVGNGGYFNVFCSGDIAYFNCMSSCSFLSAHGACTVSVTFTARNGDNSMRIVTLNGSGVAGSATATVIATDAPKQVE